MSRLDERRVDYKNALTRLKEALQEEPSGIVIDGILHRFEFTFELAWKCIKDYLEYMGISEKIGSPRENIQLAYKNGSDLVICDYVNDYSDKPSNKSSKCYISPYLHHLLLCRVTGSLCNKLVKRDIFFTPGFVFPQHSFCEDYVYSIQYAILCDTISYLPEAMYHYCHRKGSIVMADNEESINKDNK